MGRAPVSGSTQRIIIHVKGDTEAWEEPLKQLLISLKSQPGVIRHRWGMWLENPNMLELMVGWTSREERDKFVSSEAHELALQAMKPVLQAKPLAYNISFMPYAPRTAIHSPIMEFVTIYGAEDEGDERLRAIFNQVTAMDGNEGASCGFSVEEVDDMDVVFGAGGRSNGTTNITRPTRRGRVWVGASAWTSLEMSKAAEKHVYIPRVGTKTEVHHVNFDVRIKGFSVTNTVH